MKKTINHQFFFPHPAETIWEYLTNPDLLALWLMQNDFQPITGHEFQLRTNPIPSLDFDGIIYCKVIEIVPFKHLSYSWNSGPGDGIITLNSMVSWRLEPSENGTQLFLEHSGFKMEENLEIYKGLLAGWEKKLEKIAGLLNAEQYGNTNS